MGYSHCDQHNEDATNGCESCYREELEVMTDAQVIRHTMVSADDHLLHERLCAIANRLEQKPCAKCRGPLGDRYYSDVPGVGDLCLECHGGR